jgi:hypothetical protein
MVISSRRAPIASRAFRHDPLVMSISQLDDDEILAMHREDLLEVIRLSRGLKALAAIPAVLRACPREQLVEFAMRARDNCREETAPPQCRLDLGFRASAG